VRGPLFTKPSRRVLLFWAMLAGLNLAAGVVISTQPHRLTDLESVLRWERAWLLEGDNIYRLSGSYVDYPPNAIVLLSPLALLPASVASPFWVLVNIGFACLAAYLAARFFRPYDPFRVVLLPVLMFLTWGGVRTLAQFSLAALVLSMLTLKLAERRPGAAGVFLGLAMMKPQVAVPVFLWSIFTRRWRLAGIAASVVAGLFAVFCVWSRSSPASIVVRYVEILAFYHTGHEILAGVSELRPLIRQIGAANVDFVVGWVGLALLAGISIAGFQEGTAIKRILYAAPPLAACWSLLTFYHLTYGFVVLLPVMMLLALNDTGRSSMRVVMFWVLQLGMMFDVPGMAQRLGLAGTAVYSRALVHADRVLIVVLIIGLGALAWRDSPALPLAAQPPEPVDRRPVR
jgi:hypothetical protein